MKTAKKIIHLALVALIIAVIYIRTDVFIVIGKTLFSPDDKGFASDNSQIRIGEKSFYYIDKKNRGVIARSYLIDKPAEILSAEFLEKNHDFARLPDDRKSYAGIFPVARRIITISGSGTYHHHTLQMIKQMPTPNLKPEILFLIDAHADARKPPQDKLKIDCGNWINELLLNKDYGISRVIFLGGYYRMSYEGDRWLNFKLVEDDLMDVYTQPKKLKAYFKTSKKQPPDTGYLERLSAKVKFLKEDKVASFFGHPGVWIKWKTLKDFVSSKNSGNSGAKPKSYITVDLDVLSPSYITTDWGNGNLSPEQLLLLIDAIKSRTDLVGADICGWSGKEDNHSFDTIKKIYAGLSSLN